MDDNNLQDFFNLGNDDSSANANPPKDANQNPTPEVDPNIAPLDDFFNNVAPLSSASNQNNINNNANASSEQATNPVQNSINNTVDTVEAAMGQTMASINDGNTPQNPEPVHSTINTNPMQTTLTENSVNQNQFNAMPQEPDPMLEHMAENSVPGSDLNNAFSANQGAFSSPNPSDVYKNSAAMNYANNAQSQVNFNQQQQQPNAGGYSTKKKTSPILVALLILLIIAVIGVLAYFVYTTIATKKGNNNNQNENQNTVAPVDDLPDTYQYLSDIDSLSSSSKEKLENQSEYALIDSAHGLLTQSKLPMSLHFAIDGEYFVLDVNKNKDMYFEDIRIPKIQENEDDEVVFYYINSNLEFIKGSITITDLTGYDLVKGEENFETVTISLWDLFYGDKELNGFYKLNDRYFLKIHLDDSNLTSIDEEELKELLDSVIIDFSVSTDSAPSDNNPYRYLNGYVEIDEKEYKNVELDDNFSLNLVDSLYIEGWTINKTDNANVITALTKDDSYNIQIVELEEPIDDIDNLASELATDYNASQTLFAKYTDDSGFELDVPVIADENGNLLGIALESEETCYLFLIAGSSIESGSYGTTYITQEAFLDQMTYLFMHVINHSSDGSEQGNAPSPTEEDDDEDEDEDNENTNSVNNSATNSNTNTNTTEDEDENEVVNEAVEDEEENVTTNTRARNTSTR